MQKMTLAMMVLLLGGCSGGDDEPACNVMHREGTYLMHATAKAGATCATPPDHITRFSASDAEMAGEGCMYDEPNSWSADECSLTESTTCELSDGTLSLVGISHERDGGNKVTGTVSIQVHDVTGELVCSGTYDVTWTRQ